VAVLHGLSVIPEVLLIATDAKATVWQQISARLAVGLSLLLFAVCAGIASLIQAVQSAREDQRRQLDLLITINRETKLELTAKAAARVMAPSELRKPALPEQGQEEQSLAATDPDALKPNEYQFGNIVVKPKPTPDPTAEAAAKLYGKPPALR
jgi:hypothetical protein